jgi:two-component system sensor histidine kinase EvgS
MLRIPAGLFFIALLFCQMRAFPQSIMEDSMPMAVRDTIVVGVETEYPPFSMLNARGEADGFAVELFRAAADKMGSHVVLRPMGWDRLVSDLAAGAIDAIPFVVKRSDRENLFDLTVPYLKGHAGVFMRIGDEPVTKLAELEGKEIIVLKEGYIQNFLGASGKSKLIKVPTVAEGLKLLASGRHDVMVTQRLVAAGVMNREGITGLRAIDLPVPGFNQSYCFATAEGNGALLDQLNDGLAIVISDGTLRKLQDKWFGSNEQVDFRRSRIWVGGDSGFPPFEFLDENGEPVGFNIELIRAIARVENLSIDIQLEPLDELAESLENDRIDVVTGMYYSESSDAIFDFSAMHNMVMQEVIYRKTDHEPAALADLKGKSILVASGDKLAEEFASEAEPGSIIKLKSQLDVLRYLAAGEADFAIVPGRLAQYYLDRLPLGNLRISHNCRVEREYCFAVLDGNPEILEKLDEGYQKLKNTEEYREIYQKWLGNTEEQSYLFRSFIKYSLFILLPLLVLLVGTIAWSRTLKREVNRRTEKLVESESRFRQLTENSHQVFWLTDWITRKLLYVSPAYEEIYGMSVESAYTDRLGWKKPIHPDDIEMVNEVFNASRDRGIAVSAEYRIIRNDGDIRWILDRSYPVFDQQGTLYRFVSISEDITARKTAELRLLETNQLLAAAKEKAEESDRLKSSFLANMSHEIRTPMNGIFGFAELLEDPHLTGDEQKRYVGIIQQSGERMLALINDLIDISKIEAGQMSVNIRETFPAAIMNDLYAFFLAETNRKGLVLTLVKDNESECRTIMSDPDKLNQVMVNLIKNAIKFTSKGRITFGFNCLSDSIEFFVTDTGSGIAPENHLKIFDRFIREQGQHVREIEGTGLGLSISKAYVEMMGGHIMVESAPGKGSTFTFILPV